MELDDGLSDDEPVSRWLPPDDRLWRHPSEVAAYPRAPLGPALPPPAARPRLDPGWSLAFVAGLVGAMASAALVLALGGARTRTITDRVVERVATALPVAPSGGLTDVTGIAERLRPAVVQVEVDRPEGGDNGSGVVFRSDGHVLTNHHLVAGAESLTVVTADGQEHDGRVVGGDADTDVAVVRMAAPQTPAIRARLSGAGADRTTGRSPRLPTAVLGSAVNLKVGQPVVALGSPQGRAGGPSVSVGVVSALGRTVGSSFGPSLLEMIQTDAPVAPGSSGGSLLDATGAVVGIITAVTPEGGDAEGLGFATPIDVARGVAEELMTKGRVTHVWLGVEGEDLPQTMARRLGIDGGVVVRAVRPGSPAADTEIAPRDVITSIDRTPVSSMSGLVVALRRHGPGDVVDLDVIRDGQARSAKATLTERPQES